MNYYVLLGVARDATNETIRQAFRALARQYHPDAGEGSSAETFRQIVNAYETLSDPARRRAYDHSLAHYWLQPTAGQHFAVRSAPEPLIPASPRRTATLRQPRVVRDEILEQLLADDLFEIFDQLFFRPRHPFPF
jgi:curved DNA-binding protein CbpA